MAEDSAGTEKRTAAATRALLVDVEERRIVFMTRYTDE